MQWRLQEKIDYPLKIKKEMNESSRGTVDVAYSNNIIVQKWKDNTDVILLMLI